MEINLEFRASFPWWEYTQQRRATATISPQDIHLSNLLGITGKFSGYECHYDFSFLFTNKRVKALRLGKTFSE
jgi:hypothetical protein